MCVYACCLLLFKSDAKSQGTKDRTVPYKYAAKIQSLLPPGSESELVTVEGAGHDLTVTEPQVILSAFDKFMK